MDEKFWVGSVKNPGHPFASYVVGEIVADEGERVLLTRLIRVIEMPNDKGMGLNFMPDNFFTTDTPVPVEKSGFIFYRILDPDTDTKMIRQVQDTYARIRMTKAGLVAATFDANKAKLMTENGSL